jgi:hypothetical protein
LLADPIRDEKAANSPEDLDEIPLLVIHPERVRAKRQIQENTATSPIEAVSHTTVLHASGGVSNAKDKADAKRSAEESSKVRKKILPAESLPRKIVENGHAAEGATGKKPPAAAKELYQSVTAGGSSSNKRPAKDIAQGAGAAKRPKQSKRPKEAWKLDIKLEAADDEEEKEKKENEKKKKKQEEKKQEKKEETEKARAVPVKIIEIRLLIEKGPI